MKLIVAGLEARALSRTLARAVGGSAHATWERSSLAIVVQLESDGGRHVGLGEAAPLPGYSLDTLDMAVEATAQVRASLPWTLPSGRLVAELESRTKDLPPSARAAIEAAVLDAAGQALGRPLWSLLREGTASSLSLSAVLDAPPAGLAAQSRALLAAGVATQKRKLAPSDAAVTLAALAPISETDAQLRLDANRSFSPEAFAALTQALASLRPSFIEEPVEGDLAAWLADRKQGLRFAADESLAAMKEVDALATLQRFAPAIDRGVLTTVVLKPARDGLLGALALGRKARELGAAVVVTHLWDGPRGHRAALHLALALGDAYSPAQGLSLHAGLGDTAIDLIEGGRIVVPTAPGLGACA